MARAGGRSRHWGGRSGLWPGLEAGLDLQAGLLARVQAWVRAGVGTYGSRAKCGSFDDCIWLSQIKLEFEKLQILVPPVT